LQKVRRDLLNPEDVTHGQIIDSERRHGEQNNTEVRQREQTTDTLRRRGERTNPEVRQQEQTSNAERMRDVQNNTEVRRNELTSNSERMRDVQNNTEVRRNELTSNPERMRDVQNNTEVRQNEQTTNTQRRRVAQNNPEVTRNEQTTNTQRRRVAWTQPDTREQEARNARARRLNKTHEMVCRYIPETGEFAFHQPCGQWNTPCIHNCGHMHLSSSTIGTRKKCCAGGKLSNSSPNCDHELLEWFDLRKVPNFMQRVISSGPEFSTNSSTYNNLVAMGAIEVCNYESTPGFSYRGPGRACFFLMVGFIISSGLQQVPILVWVSRILCSTK
jgi:hypothetical protein